MRNIVSTQKWLAGPTIHSENVKKRKLDEHQTPCCKFLYFLVDSPSVQHSYICLHCAPSDTMEESIDLGESPKKRSAEPGEGRPAEARRNKPRQERTTMQENYISLVGTSLEATEQTSLFDLLQEAKIKHSGKADKYTLKQKAKATAEVWKFYHVFDLTEHPDKIEVACCNLCGSEIQFKGGSTGGLGKHLLASIKSHIKFSQLIKLVDKKSGTTLLSMATTSKQTTIKTVPMPTREDKADLRLYTIAMLIASKNLCLTLVDDDIFKKLIGIGDPAYMRSPINYRGVVRELKRIEDEMRVYLMEETRGQSVSLTIDHWTSLSMQNFTGITEHWIDDEWELQALPLGCFLHEGDSKSESIFEDLFTKLFGDCGFTEGLKVVAVVSDTTGNMNKFGRLLEDKDIPHLYCADHMLQLTAKLAYNDITYASSRLTTTIMKKSRSLVDYFSSSHLRDGKLKQEQIRLVNKYTEAQRKKPVGVVVDVTTRWWSTHDMIQRLIYLKPALEGMVVNEDIPKDKWLLNSEWQLLQEIQQVLAPFKEAQVNLEGEKYVTVSLMPLLLSDIMVQMKKLVEDHDKINVINSIALFNLGSKLLADLTHRWGNQITYNGAVQRGSMNRQIGVHPTVVLACAVDPRFKALATLDDSSRKRVYDHLIRMMEKMDPAATLIVANECPDVSSPRTLRLERLNRADNLTSFADLYGSAESDLNEAQLEMFRYCKADQVKITENPLRWWKENAREYPRLAKITKKLLAIPSTSAPSERVFSKTARILDKTRCAMSPGMTSTLLFVNAGREWFERKKACQR